MADRSNSSKVPSRRAIASPSTSSAGTGYEHAEPAHEVLKALGGDEDSGLASEAIDALRRQSGWNELVSAPEPPLWRKFIAQFNNVVVWVLMVAALVSGALAD